MNSYDNYTWTDVCHLESKLTIHTEIGSTKRDPSIEINGSLIVLTTSWAYNIEPTHHNYCMQVHLDFEQPAIKEKGNADIL